MSSENEEAVQPAPVTARSIYRQARNLAAARADYDLQRGLDRLSARIWGESRGDRGAQAVAAARAEAAGARPDGITVLRIVLGTHLRRLRESRGISVRQAAVAIRASESKVRRIERGRNAIREIDVLDLLMLYGVVGDDRDQLLTLAEQANEPGWWHRYNDILPEWFQAYVGMEEAARSIRVYEPQFIPGLLQTEEYAAAVIADSDFAAEDAERHVVLRKERQRRFREGKLQLWVVLDEAALRRPVGGADVQIEQLIYLRKQSSTTELTLQVIPYGAGGYTVPGGFCILQFADRRLPDIVYVEHLTSALYLDKQEEVERYRLAMERLSIAACEPSQIPQVLDQIIAELDIARGI